MSGDGASTDCANCGMPLSWDEGRNCQDCVERYAIDDWENKR